MLPAQGWHRGTRERGQLFGSWCMTEERGRVTSKSSALRLFPVPREMRHAATGMRRMSVSEANPAAQQSPGKDGILAAPCHFDRDPNLSLCETMWGCERDVELFDHHLL